jgi:hypothetical protein
MALLLSAAEAEVRALTRHDSDLVRLTPALVLTFLNREYRKLRTWLQGVAPQLYLYTSAERDVAPPDDIALGSTALNFENIYRVERKYDGDGSAGCWRSVDRASDEEPNRHAGGVVTWREEAKCLKFGPDDAYQGTYRVLYHVTPANLVEPGDQFQIPVVLEGPLIFRVCGLVALRDGDGPRAKKEFDEMSAAALDEARAMLVGRHGVHGQHAGMQEIIGY